MNYLADLSVRVLAKQIEINQQIKPKTLFYKGFSEPVKVLGTSTEIEPCIYIILSPIDHQIQALMIGQNGCELIDEAKNMDNYSEANNETFSRFIEYVENKDRTGVYNYYKEKILGNIYELSKEESDEENPK